MQRKTWNKIIPAVAGLAATVVATLPAAAHEGHHETLSFTEQVRHLVSQPDHLVAAAGLVVLVVAGGWGWRRARAQK